MPTRSWIFAASLALAIVVHAGDTLAKQIFYKGYTIEAGEGADSSPDWNTMVARLDGQIDIMEQVGLPPRVSDFFKSRPLEVDRSLRGAGEYIDRRLVINPALVDNIHPVALHEYLHALHIERIGVANADIRNAFQRAKSGQFYPETFARAHFLENEKEYFAVLGTIYLFTRIQQPPFDCAILKAKDPVFIAYLASVLGPHHGCD